MPVSLPPEPFVTQEVRIVDQQGRPRIVLSASNGVPTLVLLSESGTVGATVALDAAGRPSVTLANPNPAWPTAALAVDDKGAHVKFDRPGGASSYLFLNNAGGSGVVLVDNTGKRRLNATVAADGTANVEPLSVDGKAPQ